MIWRRALGYVCAATVALPVVAQVAEAPLVSKCRALLQALDGAWNAGDADAYLRQFQVENPLLHDLHSRRTRARLGKKQHLQRTSQMGEPRRVGDDYVAVPVLYETSCGRPDVPPLREGGLLVAKQLPDRLQLVLAVDLPSLDCANGDVFTCPPCNYRIGGAHGWLCVPIAPERTAGFDGATFLLLGTGIAVDITVELGEAPLPASAVVEGLAAELPDRIAAATGATSELWQPPGVPAGTAGLGGARITVDLRDGDRVVLYASVLGRLRHLLMLRGPRAMLQAQSARIDELLATYQLCTADGTPGQHVLSAIAAHTGGALAGDGNYRNDRHGVVASGPQGWHGSQRCGGARFQVAWISPSSHGRMWLWGHAPPRGFEHWTAALADRWLDNLLERGQLSLQAEHDTGWKPMAAGGAQERELVTVTAVGAPRRMRLLLREDLLVVADACASDADCEAAVAKALASVRLLR